MTTPEVELIAIDRIQVVAQVRTRTNWDVVQEYADLIQSGAIFPAVEVCTLSDRNYYLSDGHHRLAAYQKLGHTVISALIYPGDERAALLRALGANADHGLPRSRHDKRRAVTLALADPDWHHWSDRQIAEATRTSHTFVSGLRKELYPPTQDQSPVDPVDSGNVATGKKISASRLTTWITDWLNSFDPELGLEAQAEMLSSCLLPEGKDYLDQLVQWIKNVEHGDPVLGDVLYEIKAYRDDLLTQFESGTLIEESDEDEETPFYGWNREPGDDERHDPLLEDPLPLEILASPLGQDEGPQEDPESPTDELTSDDWYTPKWLIERVRSFFGGTIDLDPCSNSVANEVIQAATYYTKEDNGLVQDWSGRLWINPPYSDPGPWVLEAIEALDVDQALILVNSTTDVGWFQYALESCPVLFFKGRISFWRPDKPEGGNRVGQALIYVGPDKDRFAAEFGDLGQVWMPKGFDQNCDQPSDQDSWEAQAEALAEIAGSLLDDLAESQAGLAQALSQLDDYRELIQEPQAIPTNEGLLASYSKLEVPGLDGVTYVQREQWVKVTSSYPGCPWQGQVGIVTLFREGNEFSGIPQELTIYRDSTRWVALVRVDHYNHPLYNSPPILVPLEDLEVMPSLWILMSVPLKEKGIWKEVVFNATTTELLEARDLLAPRHNSKGKISLIESELRQRSEFDYKSAVLKREAIKEIYE